MWSRGEAEVLPENGDTVLPAQEVGSGSKASVRIKARVGPAPREKVRTAVHHCVRRIKNIEIREGFIGY